MNKRKIGSICEEYASLFLKSNNYSILERNFHYGRFAEIDIIAFKDSTLHFVEVKGKSNNKFGLPRDEINGRKIANIKKAARYYISISNSFDKDVAFDLVEVYFSINHDLDNSIIISNINIIENAF